MRQPPSVRSAVSRLADARHPLLLWLARDPDQGREPLSDGVLQSVVPLSIALSAQITSASPLASVLQSSASNAASGRIRPHRHRQRLGHLGRRRRITRMAQRHLVGFGGVRPVPACSDKALHVGPRSRTDRSENAQQGGVGPARRYRSRDRQSEWPGRRTRWYNRHAGPWPLRWRRGTVRHRRGFVHHGGRHAHVDAVLGDHPGQHILKVPRRHGTMV